MKVSKKFIHLQLMNFDKMIFFGKITANLILKNNLRLIYLKGDLGAGKTSLVRSIMSGLGITEVISSPSFSIVEIYKIDNFFIAHMDFFRIRSPFDWRDGELRTYFEDDKKLIFLEWPDKAKLLPEPNLLIEIFLPKKNIKNNTRDLKISGSDFNKLINPIKFGGLEK